MYPEGWEKQKKHESLQQNFKKQLTLTRRGIQGEALGKPCALWTHGGAFGRILQPLWPSKASQMDRLNSFGTPLG